MDEAVDATEMICENFLYVIKTFGEHTDVRLANCTHIWGFCAWRSNSWKYHPNQTISYKTETRFN